GMRVMAESLAFSVGRRENRTIMRKICIKCKAHFRSSAGGRAVAAARMLGSPQGALSMSLTAVAILVVLFLLAAWAVVIYNSLVRLKHGVSKAWSNIDVLLKQRHDELPKLVETCKQYMQHERTTLERVIAARSAVASAREQHDVGALGKAE